jgi:outer membrane protein TolC
LTDKTAQVTQPPDRGAGPVRLAGGSTTAVAAKPHLPDALGPDAAVQFALENNPSLLAIREQRGFAQGGVVIARTYPYNPTLLVYETGANGPPSAGVTNHAFTEAIGRLDLEVRGQGKHRMATARAVLTRTEWEIAAQELIVSIATARAFDTVLYRQRKLEVLEDTIKFNEQVVERVKALADLGRLRPADLILARTELDTARAALGQGKTALAQARAALRQQFGTLDDSFAVRGELDLPVPTTEFDVYAQVALEQRPDVQVRRAAAEEARARARLQRADRFGNPSVGPFFELNETNVAFVGAALFAPIPVLNTRRGEIMQAEALAARAQAEVRQFEIQSAQDVQAALARLTEARKWVESYTGTVLPNLRKAVEDTNKLFEQNDPGADVLRVIGVQRNYLRALDASYDALFELSQARADLAAAVGDPNLALGRYPAPAKGK